MNATLQCMLNSPGFADLFENEGSYMGHGKYGLAQSFAGLVKDARRHDLKKLSPSDVKSSASNKARIFGGYGQQDAHEFLVHFLEAISIDLNRVKSKPKYVELDYHTNRTKQQNVRALFPSQTIGSSTIEHTRTVL
jgi:ubiquitin carboxyl-terminal hydrolase 4/11/15